MVVPVLCFFRFFFYTIILFSIEISQKLKGELSQMRCTVEGLSCSQTIKNMCKLFISTCQCCSTLFVAESPVFQKDSKKIWMVLSHICLHLMLFQRPCFLVRFSHHFLFGIISISYGFFSLFF